jgi:HEAT repeat protein
VSFLFPSQTITFEAALRDIASGSPKARAAAAHALGDVSDATEKRRAVDALVRALDDNHPGVRMEACASLGELGEPGTLPALLKRLDDGEPAVRQNAAIALGTLGHADAFEPLAERLKQGPADLRFQAATSLAEIDPARAFEPVLTALEDSDPQVVAAAALSLGAIAKADPSKRERALGQLRPKFEFIEASAKFDIAYALAELGSDAGRTTLSDACTDEDRAWDAVSALAELRAIDELVRVVANKKSAPEARALAAGKLLAFGATDTGARTVLLDSLTSRRGHVRGIAVEQLAEVGGPWAKAPLEKLARSGKSRELAESIAAALKQIDAREARS